MTATAPLRLVLLGNAGSGKTTLARRLAVETGAAVLSLDAVAFGAEAVRRPLDESAALLAAFQDEQRAWIVEGCYADLAALALERAEALRFLNPGVAACLAHCRARPFEPDKFESPERQDARLDDLLAWVATYEERDDEFGLAAHRRVFEAFTGAKREDRDPAAYAAG